MRKNFSWNGWGAVALMALGLTLTGCGDGGAPIADDAGAPVAPAASVEVHEPAELPAALAHGQHLTDAVEFVQEISARGTVYVRGGSKVIWPGIKGGPMCRTDCSGLLNELLTHSLGYTTADFPAWFGRERPLAKDWYAAIAAGRGFAPITQVEHLSPGDFLVVKFPAGGEVTGHCMLVVGAPKQRAASAPLQDGLTQWEVEVIDASKSPHGEGDTRHLALKPLPPPDPNRIEQVDITIEPVEGPPPGSAPVDASGLGRGSLRLYSDQNGRLAGYAWSVSAESKFKPAGEYRILGGRWLQGFDPHKSPEARAGAAETDGD